MNKMGDKVSLVVPVFNTAKYLGRCIDSILHQSYKNIEIVLVDDGSTDESGKLCDYYSKEYNNIIVIHKCNEGLGLARNTGIENATGDYITFVDSDDYIGPDHIEMMMFEIAKNNADVCYTGFSSVIGDTIEKYPNILAGKVIDNNQSIITEIIPRMCGQTGSYGDSIQMSVCMALYDRKIIDSFDVSFKSERQFVSEDLLFNIDYLIHSHKVVINEKAEYYYYMNLDSLSHGYSATRFDRSKRMMNELIRVTKELGIRELCQQRILNSFISTSRNCLQLEEKNKYKNKNSFTSFKSIIDDKDLQYALRTIDNANVRFRARLVNCLIRNRQYKLLWIIMWGRNKFGI